MEASEPFQAVHARDLTAPALLRDASLRHSFLDGLGYRMHSQFSLWRYPSYSRLDLETTD
jgi:hypothetical protein